VQSIAAVAVFAIPGRELGGPGGRVAQALGIGKGAELSLLVLALLLLPLAVLFGLWLRVLGVGSGPPFGFIIVGGIGLSKPLCLARRKDEIPGGFVSR
jgi:hypothetical protein